jgi:hypothetical protein
MTAVLETIGFFLLAAAVWILSWTAIKNWKGQAFLCDDCKFNDEELCHKQERPYAISCTAYRRASDKDYK